LSLNYSGAKPVNLGTSGLKEPTQLFRTP